MRHIIKLFAIPKPTRRAVKHQMLVDLMYNYYQHLTAARHKK